ncbi:MAG: hypothetical protein Phog2KO_23230 [Phototrophicaceae bacterium]
MAQKSRFTLLIGILFLGLFLRLYQLDTVAFRGDEAFSVQRWSATPITEALTEIASIEPHPPLTYVLFRIWGQIFGTESEFALRLLPVFFNLLGIPAMYALAKRLSGEDSMALLSAFLWAIHPFEIWHAQDFRNYGVWAGLSVMTLWLALRVIQSPKPKLKDWFIYTSIALFSCLIFYNELITIGVLGLYVIAVCWRRPKFVVQWSVLNGVIIAITIAVFVIFQGDLITGGGYGGTTGGFEIEQYWQRFIPVLSFGDTLSLSLLQQFNPSTNWWMLIGLMVSAMLIYVAISRPKQSVFIIMLAIIPLITLGVISTQLAIFRPRYVMLAVPAYILLVSYSVYLLWQTSVTKIVSFALLFIWIGISAVSLNNYYHNPAYEKAPDWRALMTYLEQNVGADEVIIQTSVDASFGYYYGKSEIVAGEFALPADVTQPIPDVIDAMQATSEQFDSFWVLGQTFPDWQNAGVVEDWAFDNLQLTRETSLLGLPVRQFMAWTVDSEAISNQPLVTFADNLSLLETVIFAPEPTNELSIHLYWDAIEQTDSPMTIFVHLVGSINPETGSPLWAQDDHPPQNGRVSTDLWQVDTIYRDVYVLDLEAVPSGEYQIFVGFYDPVTNERMLTENAEDAYIIGEIILE